MNRQIKFRVWDKKNSQFLKYWHNDVDKTTFDLWSWADFMSTCLIFPEDDLVFVQYTGLKDSKGNEVYEGDIVKYKTWTGSYDGTTEEHQTQVQFKDGAYYPRYIDDECEDSWYSFKV